MAKLLFLSDSHGHVANLLAAVEREAPDAVFHMGDLWQDAQDLHAACPGLPLYAVAGNCDGFAPRLMLERTVEVEGMRFFLTHGHLYPSRELLARAGRAQGADAVLSGHSHIARAEREPGDLWLINPGTAGGVRRPPTYAVGELSQGALTVRIVPLP